jgi:nitrite reductase (NADH) large subunit
VHVVGQEAHPLYNRIGIGRLIWGRSAMQGLYLQPDSWYAERRITSWLNTRAVRLDLADRAVVLGTGETLRWDRLVLATGSAAAAPAVPGFGRPGSFVLREAGDAIAIRAYAQRHGVRTALVLGGGLLGLEAAHALHQLGLGAAVLERSDRLLHRQVDERASELLAGYFAGLGIEVHHGVEVAAVEGGERVERVLLTDGRAVPTELVLACTGIRPEVGLARDAGLRVGRGILVDERMRTSAEDVWAAGDAAEFAGRVTGLWPDAVAQAEVAAANATSGEEVYRPRDAAVILKGVGLDLTAAGRVVPAAGDEVVALAGPATHDYVSLVVDPAGTLAGGLVLGRPADAPTVLAAVRARRPVGDHLDALRAGDLGVLS